MSGPERSSANGRVSHGELCRRQTPAKATPATPTSRAVTGPELFVTVFVTGAAVMTVEIVGTRIIGPVFGVGLFV